MDAHYARAFVNAARRICSEMLDLETTVLTPRILTCHAPRHYITGVINLSGDRECTVSIGFDRMVAVRATEFLLGNRPSKVNAQVVDAVGELTNQIAGVARQNLLPLSLAVSIPQVICGISQSIPFPRECQRVSVPMASIWGNLAIDFGFAANKFQPGEQQTEEKTSPEPASEKLVEDGEESICFEDQSPSKQSQPDDSELASHVSR